MSSKIMSEKKIQSVEMFKSQDEALTRMRELGHTKLCKIGKYSFFTMKDNESFGRKIEREPNNYFEVLIENQPCYLYCDMDGEFVASKTEERQILSCFLRMLQKTFKDYLNEDFDYYNVRFLTNHRKDKFSIHFSYIGKTFSNHELQKAFWKWMIYEINQDKEASELLFFTKQKDNILTKKCIIDMLVYTKNRAMRTINSFKENKDEGVLTPFKWCGVDTGYLDEDKDYITSEYLLHHLKITKFYKLRRKYEEKLNQPKPLPFELEDIKTNLESKHPNLKILNINQFGLYLTRKQGCKDFKCVCGDNHSSNNANLVIRNNGLYFRCIATGEEELFMGREIRNKEEEYYWTDYQKLSKIENITEEEIIKFCDDAFQFITLGDKPTFRARYLDENSEVNYRIIEKENISMFSNFKLKYIIDKEDKNSLMSIIWHLINENKIKTYIDTTFKPYNKVLPKIRNGYINTFIPFKFKSYEPKRFINFEDTKLFYHFKHVICSNHEPTFKYLKQFLGDKLQNIHITADERGVCLVVRGREGAGKDIFFKAFMKLLGDDNCKTTELGKELFDNFNGSFENKLMVVVSETDEKSDMRKNAEQFKGIITAKKLTYNSKGKAKRFVDHRTSYITTTNNRNAMSVGRRHFEIEVNDKHVGDWDYFNELGKEVSDDDVIKSMFDYFDNVELRGFTCLKYPTTNAIIEAREEQAPNIIKFLIEYLPEQTLDIELINYNEFRNRHDNYCRFNGLKPCSSIVFGREMKKLGCERKRSKMDETGTRPWMIEINKFKTKGEIKSIYKIDFEM